MSPNEGPTSPAFAGNPETTMIEHHFGFWWRHIGAVSPTEVLFSLDQPLPFRRYENKCLPQVKQATPLILMKIGTALSI